MNQPLLFIAVLLFAALPGSQQVKPAKAATAMAFDTVKAVTAIKAQFNAIDLKRKLYAQYEPLEHTEGVLYTGYYEGTAMKMLNVSYFADAGKTESDEYVNETGVFFIYSKVFEYVSPLSANPRTPIKGMTENWYYFNKESLIKWVMAGKVKPCGSDEFKAKDAFFKDEFKKTKAAFHDLAALRKIK